MKLARSLLAAWLTVMVLALVPQYRWSEAGTLSVVGDIRDYVDLDPILDARELHDDLAEQSYFEDPYVTPGPNSTHKSAPAYYAAILPPDVTGWNTTTSVESKTGIGAASDFSFGSDPPAFPSEPKTLYAEARVGFEKQHIGTLRKGRLEKAVYECLTKICPLDDKKRGLQPCTPYNTKSCRVSNIVYNAEPHDKYATNSFLTIQVEYAFHNPVWPGLGDAVYRAAASMYRLMSDVEDGPGDDGTIKIGACQPVDFPGSRRTLLCNVPRSVSVGFPVNKDHPKGDAGEVQAMAAVSLYFNGKTDDGDYNVVFPNQRSHDAIMDRFKWDWLPHFAKSIGRPEQDLDTRVNYLREQKTCQAWFWYEDPKCKLRVVPCGPQAC